MRPFSSALKQWFRPCHLRIADVPLGLPHRLFFIGLMALMAVFMVLMVHPRHAATSDTGTPPTFLKWTQPHAGWLYVLHPAGLGPDSQIQLVDPEQAAIMGAIRVDAWDPDFAISRDGKYLYVVSYPGRLYVLDTESAGVVQTVELPDRIRYTVFPGVPSLVLSQDGRWLYIHNMRVIDDRDNGGNAWDEHTVATFDTIEGRLLPEQAEIPDCGSALMVPGKGERQLAVVCRDSNDVRFLKLDPTGARASLIEAPVTSAPSTFPGGDLVPESLRGVAAGVFSSDGTTFGLMRGDGALWRVNPAAGIAKPTGQVTQSDRYTPFRAWPLSPDGRKVYVGQDLVADQGPGFPEEIRVFDTTSWDIIAQATIRLPFWSLAVSPDSRYLYAVSTGSQSVLVMEASTLKEIRTIKVGKNPAIALVAP